MTIRAPAARRGQLARLLRDQNGFVMAMVAILLPVLIGVTGLAAETGLWYAIKRQNQSAADEAAISGAMELVASKPDVTAQANCSAWRNGFDSSVTSSTCPTSLTGVAVNNPPLNGAYTGNSNYVEVILSQTQNALFASLSLPSVTIVTRAVATALSTPACLLGLGTSGTDVTASGGSAINTAGCSVVTNSTSSGSVTVSGGSTLTAQTIITRGPISPNPCTAPTCTLSSPANTTAPVTTDPYASRVSSITLPTTCSNPDPNAHVNQTLSPGCYNGMTFNGGTVTTLQNGVYFINNGSGFTVHSGATVKNIPASGNGVTIVLYNDAALAVQGGTPPATLTLTAPSSGGAPYQGLLFYQVAADTQHAQLDGCSPGPPSSCNFTGALYFPTASDLVYSGNSSSTCTVFVAKKITFSGSSTLNASQCGADGVTTPSNLSGAVALAE